MKAISAIAISLVLLALGGCAGGAASKVGPAPVAPTVDITGKWTGSWVATNPALGSGIMEMTLKQEGPKFSGDLRITGTPTNPSGPTEGIVSGNEVRVLRPASVTGSFTAEGDTMKGTVQGMIAANVTLTRQK